MGVRGWITRRRLGLLVLLNSEDFGKKCGENCLVGWARRALWSLSHMSFISGSGAEELGLFLVQNQREGRVQTYLSFVCAEFAQICQKSAHEGFRMRPVTIWIPFSTHDGAHTLFWAASSAAVRRALRARRVSSWELRVWAKNRNWLFFFYTKL